MKKNLYYKTGKEGNVDFADRWDDLQPLIEADSTQTALDIGCAEGLIAIELSKLFRHVYAFDIEPYRIQLAKQNAKMHNNIDFSTQNYINYDYKEYDNVFCLGVYHKIKSSVRQNSLNDMFKKCKRYMYLRIPVLGDGVNNNVGVSDQEVLDIAVKNGFELLHRSEPRNLHGTIFKFKNAK